MKIALASDHGGYYLKEKIKHFLEENKVSLAEKCEVNFLSKKNSWDEKTGIFEIVDLGTTNAESVDYPVYGEKIGEYVANKKAKIGICFCGTGIGISVATNKVPGIRCALCVNPETSKLARNHNNANVLALGGRTTSFEEAKKIVISFLSSKFEGGRHERRISEIRDIEKKYSG